MEDNLLEQANGDGVLMAGSVSTLTRLRGFEGYVNRKSFKINASA
jgi:hypothetical protein